MEHSKHKLLREFIPYIAQNASLFCAAYVRDFAAGWGAGAGPP
jgi:hypothetical protein